VHDRHDGDVGQLGHVPGRYLFGTGSGMSIRIRYRLGVPSVQPARHTPLRNRSAQSMRFG
jgi:hypothetical protein